jgi:AcrR family transcriptional regulator
MLHPMPDSALPLALPHPDAAAPERPRRNRSQTEARLRRAVEELLVEGGFAALTPTAVGQRAGVNKMLIYRYFGDLPGLVRSIAYAEDFFPTFDSLRDEMSMAQLLALPVSRRAAWVLDRNARQLLERPVVLELMVWELVERNELTAIMEEARETLGLQLLRELFPDVADIRLLQAVSAVLSAGVTYLALRRRKIRLYGGLDLTTDAAWTDIARAIETMTRGFDAPEQPA